MIFLSVTSFSFRDRAFPDIFLLDGRKGTLVYTLMTLFVSHVFVRRISRFSR